MMTDNLDEVRDLAATLGKDFALVVNHSGGKDSMRMLGFIRENFPDCNAYAVMADTGFEHQAPISATEWAQLRCRDYGLDLTVVRNAKCTYLQMVEQRRLFLSAQFRQCTSDLKRSPIDKFIRSLPQRLIINCIGIRAEESTQRGKLATWKRSKSLTTRQRTVYNWLPIFRFSLEEILDWHRVRRVPLHPVYVPEYYWDCTLGGYLRRLSCRVCIFSTVADTRAIYQHDHSSYEAISALEQKIGFTMRPGASLVQILQNANASVERRSQRATLLL
jgi:3'-phosphoadenosine 5'-phosphosulfate sulfotransferase (PAPS reductase)/FAD synthetase